MTMNYCGRCGSANGATARYCRQCGADLSSQAAASSSSGPFNVEFSTRSVKKNTGKIAGPASSEPGSSQSGGMASSMDADPASGTMPDAPGKGTAGATPRKDPDSVDRDPKAISASLRRIRASGPLIIAAIKQNDQESMERINEIIEQSIQGMNENKAPVESSNKSADGSGNAVAFPASSQTRQLKAREATQPLNSPAKQASDPQPVRSINGERVRRQTNQALIRPAAQKSARAGAKMPSQTDAQTTKQKNVVAMGQAIARRVTTWLSVSNTNRSVSQTPPGGAHSGPSTVLMQASGFKPKSSMGLKVTLGVVGLAILLAFPVYFILREGLDPAQPDNGALNLISPSDQSAQLVKAALAERSQGKYKAAIEYFHHALELTPNNMDTRLILAQVYVEAGQNDEAAKNIREIIRIQPGHLDARLQLARIYHKRGNWTAAYTQYRYIIEYDQSSPQAADALAAIEEQKAIEEIAAREAERVRRGRRRLRSNIPSLPVADLPNQVPLLPSWSSEAGRVTPPAALTAMNLEKPDPRGMAEAHKRLGVRFLNIREFNAAINEFLQALNLTPDDNDLCYFIGMAYHGMGRQADAYNYYTRVDSGLYVVPAESGAKKTRKAAQEANKRRNEQKLPPVKNELEEINQNKPTKHKSVMNRILDSLR